MQARGDADEDPGDDVVHHGRPEADLADVFPQHVLVSQDHRQRRQRRDRHRHREEQAQHQPIVRVDQHRGREVLAEQEAADHRYEQAACRDDDTGGGIPP